MQQDSCRWSLERSLKHVEKDATGELLRRVRRVWWAIYEPRKIALVYSRSEDGGCELRVGEREFRNLLS